MRVDVVSFGVGSVVGVPDGDVDAVSSGAVVVELGAPPLADVVLGPSVVDPSTSDVRDDGAEPIDPSSACAV
ncbi:MAG: hypothetical protein H6512_06575 [Acidimicrobiia bacterium]|nr:hypothetical protein [Acidimicrobiia bacterium]